MPKILRQTGAGVSRIADYVAMHTISKVGGETCPVIYLTPEMAKKLGEALIESSQDPDAPTKRIDEPL